MKYLKPTALLTLQPNKIASMKLILISLCLLYFFVLPINAQVKPKNVLYENMVVRTEDGTVLPTQSWRNLMLNGRFALHKDSLSPKEEYVIYALSDSTYNARMSKLAKPKESDYFKIRQPFQINDRDINGNKIKSKDLKGHILVINFWFINCPPCRAEIPELNKIVTAFKDSANITFIGVALDSKAQLETFLKTIPFNYQIIDNGRSIADTYSIHSFPTHVIIDDEGTVYFHTSGLSPKTAYWIKKSIQQLLNKRRLVQ